MNKQPLIRSNNNDSTQAILLWKSYVGEGNFMIISVNVVEYS